MIVVGKVDNVLEIVSVLMMDYIVMVRNIVIPIIDVHIVTLHVLAPHVLN